MNINGSVAVVTGGGSGIGRAIAIALASEGADLVIADVNDDYMDEVSGEIEGLGRKILAVNTDVSKYDSVQALFEKSVSEFGRVDIMVNNAGVHMAGPIEKVTMDDWKWIIDINLYGVIHGVQAFLPHFIERGSGYFVNTASIAGQAGFLDPSIPYSVTKFGVVGLSEGLAVAVRDKGVGVTVICPSLVQTNIASAQRNVQTDAAAEAMRVRVWELLAEKDWSEILPDAQILMPEDVGSQVIQAIKEDRFLVATHDDARDLIMERATDIEGMIRRRAEARAEAEQRFSELSNQAQSES
ncbi:MAG: SDR family NAD(P)-dependent oxidoreductase [Deltaproteobacteria bacterium]|nr:SDR family NAD(P)-dependent oxidoreductase [Deltaproteobacteria bacterium]